MKISKRSVIKEEGVCYCPTDEEEEGFCYPCILQMMNEGRAKSLGAGFIAYKVEINHPMTFMTRECYEPEDEKKKTMKKRHKWLENARAVYQIDAP